ARLPARQRPARARVLSDSGRWVLRLRASSLVAITTCFALSCELGADVAHRGAYGFLPSAAVPDTTLRPLRHLLVVEEDPASERTLLYYFEGELGRAGIGLESLPRLARRHGRSAVRFERSEEHTSELQSRE